MREGQMMCPRLQRSWWPAHCLPSRCRYIGSDGKCRAPDNAASKFSPEEWTEEGWTRFDVRLNPDGWV